MHDAAAHALVVIPARGGSKGVPRKNLAEVGGVPLIARAIRTSRLVDASLHLIVTTDSREIGALALEEGCEVVWRPKALAGDTASSESALLHAIESFSAEAGTHLPKKTVMLQCTSPFVTPSDIDLVLQSLEDFDSAFTAVPDHSFRWTRLQGGSTTGYVHDETSQRVPRQELSEVLRETGGVYGMRTALFVKTGNRFCGRVGVVVINPERSLEIDTLSDLEMARSLAPWLDSAEFDSSALADIKGIAFDFDGVMTDDLVTVDEVGRESVRCSRSDGAAVATLRSQGVPMVIITKERSSCAKFRGSKLGIPVIGPTDDKVAALRGWAKEVGLDIDEIAFIGNDLNDLGVLAEVGIAACPSNAHSRVRQVCDIKLRAHGGKGAVREFAEMYLALHRKDVGDA